jgi:predicted nucleic acid-binding protein
MPSLPPKCRAPRRQLIIFDASTLVSAALKAESVPERALLRARETISWPCPLPWMPRSLRCCPAEVQRFLSEARRHTSLTFLRARAFWVNPTVRVTDCRGSKDNIYLELALEAGAETTVSSDRDLAVLNPWRGMRSLSPIGTIAQSDRTLLRIGMRFHRPACSSARSAVARARARPMTVASSASFHISPDFHRHETVTCAWTNGRSTCRRRRAAHRAGDPRTSPIRVSISACRCERFQGRTRRADIAVGAGTACGSISVGPAPSGAGGRQGSVGVEDLRLPASRTGRPVRR